MNKMCCTKKKLKKSFSFIKCISVVTLSTAHLETPSYFTAYDWSHSLLRNAAKIASFSPLNSFLVKISTNFTASLMIEAQRIIKLTQTNMLI